MTRQQLSQAGIAEAINLLTLPNDFFKERSCYPAHQIIYTACQDAQGLEGFSEVTGPVEHLSWNRIRIRLARRWLEG